MAPADWGPGSGGGGVFPKIGAYVVSHREKDLHWGPFPDATAAQDWAEEYMPSLNWAIRPVIQPTGHSS